MTGCRRNIKKLFRFHNMNYFQTGLAIKLVNWGIKFKLILLLLFMYVVCKTAKDKISDLISATY